MFVKEMESRNLSVLLLVSIFSFCMFIYCGCFLRCSRPIWCSSVSSQPSFAEDWEGFS